MALTLADLRTFASETAGADANSTSADREVNYWINSAFARLWAIHNWGHAQAVARLIMLPSESGAAMTVTQGSRTVTLTGETFDDKYVDEKWSLTVEGESQLTFVLKRIDTPTSAVLRDDDLWIRAANASATYTFARYIYPLPEGAWRVDRVENLDSFTEIQRLSPRDFDRERAIGQTSRSGHPIFFTIRDESIELWPAAGSSYVPIELSYTKQCPTYKVADPGEREVDWPESKQDVLLRAIMLEASITQGDASPVDYKLAKLEFEQALKAHRGTDSNRANLSGPMSLGRRNYHRFRGWASVE